MYVRIVFSHKMNNDDDDDDDILKKKMLHIFWISVMYFPFKI